MQQAIGAIENALLDVKARALGIPVYELLGGPVRDRIRVYWSHCATYRVRRAKEMELPPVRTLDDIVQARQGGGRARATPRSRPTCCCWATIRRRARPRLRPRRRLSRAERRPPRVRAIRDQLAAFREGAGPGHGHPGGPELQLQDRGLPHAWRGPWSPSICSGWRSTRATRKALHYIRSRTTIPVASCECLFGRRDYRPFFEQRLGGRGHHRHAVERRGRVGSRSPPWPTPTR